MSFYLGVIEGFYGEPWTELARLQMLDYMAANHFESYLYAPKADRYLRGAWREAHPDVERDQLLRLSAHAGQKHIRWGVGLSPLGLQDDLKAGRADLMRRVEQLLELGIDQLAILFDDMNSSIPDLAKLQSEVLADVGSLMGPRRLLMCPSYYSDQSILDRLFGLRPTHYLEELGERLDPKIEVFWTGERVCSTSYSGAHLEDVQRRLGRPVSLWDNYPVNDGPRMCKHLHLRPYSGRGPAVRRHTRSLYVNPMTQAWLSRLPMASLLSNLDGSVGTLEGVLNEQLPRRLGEKLLADVDLFQDEGLDAIGNARSVELLDTYGKFTHPAAREIVHWLEGKSVVGPECLTNE